MKEELLELIKEIQSERKMISYDEAATKRGVILPILQCLGWNPFNIDEVHPEYAVEKRKVDYALKHGDSKKVFIEVKKVGEDLENHQEQLLNYSFKEGIKLAILTNGITWWFYLPLLEGSWEQRKFYTIEVYDQDAEDITKKFFDFLSKQNVITGKSIENAERIYTSKQKKDLIRKTLPEAWSILLGEADENLIELIAETTEKLCGYKPDHLTVESFLVSYAEDLGVTPQKTTKIKQTAKIPSKKRKKYTGKSIISFMFLDKKYKAKSWREMLRKISNIMFKFHRDDFERVLTLKGRKRPYFTKNKNELRTPEKIKGTDIYVETNLSANSIVKIARDTISLFGYESKDLSIEAE
jgi:predicted type IV restriction endonuclease